MSPRQKKSVISASPVKKVAKRAAKKHARATVKQSPGRAKRFLKSTPARVLLGAAATALVLAKLKQHLV